jgi:hypothetical protein
MKYEEIYPPRLKHLQPFVKVEYDQKLYNHYETVALTKVNFDLSFETPLNLMKELLDESNTQLYFHACYLLEISYSEKII